MAVTQPTQTMGAVGSGGRFFGSGVEAAVGDVVWAATHVALARAKRLALERIRRKLKEAIGCGQRHTFKSTCEALDAIHLSQLDTAGTALLASLREDAIRYLADSLTSDVATDLLRAIVAHPDERARLVQNALATASTHIAQPTSGLLRMALWCDGLVNCQPVHLVDPAVLQAFIGSQGVWGALSDWLLVLQNQTRRAAQGARTVTLLVDLLRSTRNGSPEGVQRAAVKLLQDEYFRQIVAPNSNALKQIGNLLPLFGPDWYRAIPTLCRYLRASDAPGCTRYLGPVMTAIGPVVQAASSAARTPEEREARREAIASALERVADMQTSRSERSDEAIVSFGSTLEFGLSFSDEVAPRPGATLSILTDLPMANEHYWPHVRLVLLDTTHLVASALQSDETNSSSNEGEASMSTATTDDVRLSDMFLPSLHLGLGFGSRELPVLATLGIGLGRHANDDVGFTALVSVALGVPLIDFN